MVTTPQQSGSVTAGHPAVWTADGVLQDGGGVTTPSQTLVALVNSGTFFSVLNAPASGAYASWQKTYTTSTLIEDLEVHSGQATISISRVNNGNTITTWNPNSFQVNNGYIGSGRAVTAAGNYTLTATDYRFVVNKTVGQVTTVTLLQSPESWREFSVYDGKGDAATNTIVISSGSGAVNINGGTLSTIVTNYGHTTFVFNGTNWMA